MSGNHETPKYYDAKIAGWWVWGLACWIGGEFCSGNGPWQVVEAEDGYRQLVHLGGAGRGVNRRPSQAAGSGLAGLVEWMRVCGGRSGDALQHLLAHGPVCGVYLDPPYSAEAGRDNSIYRVEDTKIAHAVREWCLRHGGNPRLRIVLSGYEGEHAMPRGWRCVPWKPRSGYAQLGNGNGNKNRGRERLWLSPHCLRSRTAVTA